MACNLMGRVAVITGSTQGIGWAVAQELANRGAKVVLNGRNPVKLRDRVDCLREARGTVLGLTGDMSRASDVERVASEVVQAWGRIDIWVNNAGDTVVRDSLQLEPDEFSRVVALNLNGAFYGSRAAARVMACRGGGVIVQMGSISGRWEPPGVRLTFPRSMPWWASPKC